jgi:hypothetical protein
MRWVIEQVHPENGDAALIAAVRDAGDEVAVIKPTRGIAAVNLPKGPALFHGSMQKAAEIQSQRPDISVWLDAAAFECTSYLPRVGEFLFNSTYIMLSVRDRQRPNLQQSRDRSEENSTKHKNR